MKNGNDTEKRSWIHEALRVVTDHADLFSLEARYEVDQASRRAIAIVAALVLAIAAFVYIQITIVAGLVALGIPLVYVGLLLSVLYLVGAVFIFKKFGRRDPKSGQPFEGTRRELDQTFEWIQKLF